LTFESDQDETLKIFVGLEPANLSSKRNLRNLKEMAAPLGSSFRCSPAKCFNCRKLWQL